MNTKTMAIKARLANHIRKTLYKKHLLSLSDSEKIAMMDQIFGLNLEMHWELNAYKQKRKDKAELLKKRLAAPQTQSMKKKLGLTKKTSKAEYMQTPYKTSFQIDSVTLDIVREAAEILEKYKEGQK